jgi:hypothetical protein
MTDEEHDAIREAKRHFPKRKHEFRAHGPLIHRSSRAGPDLD